MVAIKNLIGNLITIDAWCTEHSIDTAGYDIHTYRSCWKDSNDGKEIMDEFVIVLESRNLRTALVFMSGEFAYKVNFPNSHFDHALKNRCLLSKEQYEVTPPLHRENFYDIG